MKVVSVTMAAEGEAKEGDLDNYNISPNPIGTGAYGTVYYGRDVLTKQEVALKEIRIAASEEGIPLNMIREISALKKVNDSNHPNIVRYALSSPCESYFVYYENGLVLATLRYSVEILLMIK